MMKTLWVSVYSVQVKSVNTIQTIGGGTWSCFHPCPTRGFSLQTVSKCGYILAGVQQVRLGTWMDPSSHMTHQQSSHNILESSLTDLLQQRP